MRSKFLAGAAALALSAGTVLASSTPAAARWHRTWGPVAAAGAAAGAVLGGVAAATSPWWWGGYYPYGYNGYYPGAYGYAPGYNYGYAAPAWGFGESTNGYAQPEWNGTYGYAAPRDQAYCERRYRSYDPESGTFMGYDGLRHPCP